MTRSKSPVSNSGEFFAMAKARRRQKRQAKKAAKREAERSNSGNMAPQPSHQSSIQSQQALLGHGDEPESRTGLGLEKRINDEEVLRNHTAAAKTSPNASTIGDGPSQKLPANGAMSTRPRHFDYQRGREMTQAEWVAAAAKVSGGRITAKKEDMEDWVSPSASVRRRRGFARDTDLDTIRRYEHADMKLALGEMERLEEGDDERAADVRMAGM